MSIPPAGLLEFDYFEPLPIQIEVSDAPLTSDAGLLPLRQFDERIGLTVARNCWQKRCDSGTSARTATGDGARELPANPGSPEWWLAQPGLLWTHLSARLNPSVRRGLLDGIMRGTTRTSDRG